MAIERRESGNAYTRCCFQRPRLNNTSAHTARPENVTGREMNTPVGPRRKNSARTPARGSWHSYADTPLRASYHPSYLLRQEGLTSAAARKIKRDAWEDMLAVMEKAGVSISEKQQRYFL